MNGNHVMQMNHAALCEAVEFYLKEKALNKEWAGNLRVSKVDQEGKGGYGSDQFNVTLESVEAPKLPA